MRSSAQKHICPRLSAGSNPCNPHRILTNHLIVFHQKDWCSTRWIISLYISLLIQFLDLLLRLINLSLRTSIHRSNRRLRSKKFILSYAPTPCPVISLQAVHLQSNRCNLKSNPKSYVYVQDTSQILPHLLRHHVKERLPRKMPPQLLQSRITAACEPMPTDNI